MNQPTKSLINAQEFVPLHLVPSKASGTFYCVHLIQIESKLIVFSCSSPFMFYITSVAVMFRKDEKCVNVLIFILVIAKMVISRHLGNGVKSIAKMAMETTLIG